MLKVVDLKGDSDLLIKNIKNKWDRTKIQSQMRDKRFFVKHCDVKKIKYSKSLFKQRKMSAENI